MKPLLIACILFVQTPGYACGGINQQVYAGKIEYSLDPLNPFSCTAIISMDFDVKESLANDSIWVNWGDGHVNIMRGISITEDSVASENMGKNIFTHVYAGNHVYASLPAAGGYYTISFQNEYRINGVSNIASGDGFNLPYYLAAIVSIDTTAAGKYEPLAFPPLTIGFANFSNYWQRGLLQTGTDSVRYSFNTPLETVSNPVPLYQLPDQFCLANGSSENMFTIDSGSGEISWSTPCLQGVYSFGTLLNKYRRGRLISSIMREQNIYVSADYINDVQKISEGRGLSVYPNPAGNVLCGSISQPAFIPECHFDIITPDGRIKWSNIPVATQRFEIDISGLASGVYFLSFQDASGRRIQKFMKQ